MTRSSHLLPLLGGLASTEGGSVPIPKSVKAAEPAFTAGVADGGSLFAFDPEVCLVHNINLKKAPQPSSAADDSIGGLLC
ncbi:MULTISPECIES: hypothetical protein [Paenibacillus]|uniref:hypothetical protein n=1 Tax=Paenibacillus TaxID=44249 RepID=UPI0022B9103D|nr:hypothetical protein [Paenibacillus caseinilyticus]MCZ8520383.1 hypothetical protein [Paenibacillus caseinilyticus]